MAELESKKFKYKKDHMDWVIVGIIIFTLICFGAIFYGMDYFEEINPHADQGSEQIEDLEKNSAILEKQINDYLNDPDFNPNN